MRNRIINQQIAKTEVNKELSIKPQELEYGILEYRRFLVYSLFFILIFDS